MNPREPNENGTIGGTGPLNIEAACKEESIIYSINMISAEKKRKRLIHPNK